MTKVTMSVELDQDWVDCILTTAFDGDYGSCWYWVNEDEEIESLRLLADDHLFGVDFTFADGHTVLLNRNHLSEAATKVLTYLPWTETARQLREALAEPDELPDLDGEAADLLVQVALFGEVVYG